MYHCERERDVKNSTTEGTGVTSSSNQSRGGSRRSRVSLYSFNRTYFRVRAVPTHRHAQRRRQLQNLAFFSRPPRPPIAFSDLIRCERLSPPPQQHQQHHHHLQKVLLRLLLLLPITVWRAASEPEFCSTPCGRVCSAPRAATWRRTATASCRATTSSAAGARLT